MSLSNKTLIKSKTLSLRYNLNPERTVDNENDFLMQSNNSDRVMSRKSSIKQKIFSLFKSHSLNGSTVDNSAHDSSHTDSSQSTISNAAVSQKNDDKNRDWFDIRDRQLIAQLPIHSLTKSIICCVADQSCCNIRLPSTWMATMGAHLSNKAVQPFLTSVPGLLGLKNHGNTCYVNVIVQCLAHIDSVAQFFATKDYLVELNQLDRSNANQSERSNVNQSDRSITNQSDLAQSNTSLDVVVGLAYLLQSLWQHTYHQTVSINFCRLLTRHNAQFSIDSQQDAHELLLCVLNLLHDNLTRPRPITLTGNKSDAEESSFIYDRFCSWLSNEITCPKCQYTRKFRDPMLSLNLQIPKPSSTDVVRQCLFSIIVIDGNQIAHKHAFEIDKSTTVANIRAGIATRVGCQLHDIIILELVNSGFGRLYSDKELIVDISQKNNLLSPNTYDNFENGLYGVYIPNQVVDVDALPLVKGLDDEVLSSIQRQKDLLDTQPFIRLLVVHVERNREYVIESNNLTRQTSNKDGTSVSSTVSPTGLLWNHKHFIRFTNVLTVQAARKTKLSLLRHSLSEQMCKYLQLRNVTKLPKPQFLIEGSHLVSELDTYPLTHLSVTKALVQSSDICGVESAVVRLVVVWPFRINQMLRINRRLARDTAHDGRILSSNSHKISLHHSVEELLYKHNKSDTDSDSRKAEPDRRITINECLREFFSLDSVSVTESWNCPGCHSYQQAHTNIRIKQAPEILILMLKRFTNGESPPVLSQRNISKNDTLRKPSAAVQQNGTLRKENVTKKNTADKRDDNLNKLECFIDYPLENLDIKDYMEDVSADQNYLYNLVGVVNHRGNLFNGHYVAICKNSIDDRWRVYDDDRVTEIPKADVVHPDAYILFYKRHSIASDIDSELNLHWSYRRLSFPDKIHRNHGPNPITLYSKPKHCTDKDSTKSRDSIYNTLPLKSSNNHNSNPDTLSLRLSSIIEQSIMSPHLSSTSSSSSLITGNTGDDCIDISTIVSDIVDLDSCTVAVVNRYAPDECDSGTVVSRRVSASSSSANENTVVSDDVDNNDHDEDDECYCSLSSTSSPSASTKLTLYPNTHTQVQ